MAQTLKDGGLAGGQENLQVAYPRGDSMNKSEKEGAVVVARNLLESGWRAFVIWD